MGDPLSSVLTAHSDHPLANRRINESVTPQDVAEAREAPDQLSNRIVLDNGDLALYQRRQIVVHCPEMKALKIGYVAGYVKRKYLSLPVVQNFVPLEPPIQH